MLVTRQRYGPVARRPQSRWDMIRAATNPYNLYRLPRAVQVAAAAGAGAIARQFGFSGRRAAAGNSHHVNPFSSRGSKRYRSDPGPPRGRGGGRRIGRGGSSLYRRRRRRRAGRRRTRIPRHKLGPVQIKKTTHSGVLTTNENECEYAYYQIGDQSEINALMDNYYQLGMDNANTTQRLENLNLRTTGKKLLIKNCRMSTTFKNNYSTTVRLHIYEVTPRLALPEAVTPISTIKDGLDQRAGTVAGWEYEPQYQAEHSNIFRKCYRTIRRRIITLKPGDSTTFHINTGRYFHNEDIFTYAVENKVEYRPYKTRMLLVRCSGTIGHAATGETTDSIGYMDTKVDFMQHKSYHYQFVDGNEIIRWVRSDAYATGLEEVQGDEPQTVNAPDEL